MSGGRHISILAVLADRDSRPWYMVIIIGISILAVLADRDLPDVDGLARLHVISILAVLADRDGIACLAAADHREISILAVLADRDPSSYLQGRKDHDISILAVLADRDAERRDDPANSEYFNPRGPCGPRRDEGRELGEC